VRVCVCVCVCVCVHAAGHSPFCCSIESHLLQVSPETNDASPVSTVASVEDIGTVLSDEKQQSSAEAAEAHDIEL